MDILFKSLGRVCCNEEVPFLEIFEYIMNKDPDEFTHEELEERFPKNYKLFKYRYMFGSFEPSSSQSKKGGCIHYAGLGANKFGIDHRILSEEYMILKKEILESIYSFTLAISTFALVIATIINIYLNFI